MTKVVYLARQLSLDRSVALKVTAFQSSEGRSLARLDHEHIVQVFSENVDSSGSWHLLCMRYVAGPTQLVIRSMSGSKSCSMRPFLSVRLTRSRTP